MPVLFITAISVLVVLACLWPVAHGHGLKGRVLRRLLPGSAAWLHHPSVTASRPASYESGVAVDAFVAADVLLPNPGKVIDATTVGEGSIRLYRTGDRKFVHSVSNTSGGGDSIVLKPLEPLELNTQYTFEVLPALKDTAGASFQPFAASFTTAATTRAGDFAAAFEPVQLVAAAGNKVTGLTVGPDHRLYAGTLDGRILRYDIQADGTVRLDRTIATVQAANGGTRLLTGLRFDPAASDSDLILWVSHGASPSNHVDDWTGKISRLRGGDLDQYTDVVIHLPRGSRDHLTNQLDFGPDGALYFGQASNTATGGPDSQWGYRPEHLLTAAILRLDAAAIHAAPLDAKTDEDGHYDPFAPGAVDDLCQRCSQRL